MPEPAPPAPPAPNPGEIEALAAQHARSIAKEYLERSLHVWERVDQFSTWMLGGAGAAAALMIANIASMRVVMGPWHTRLVLWTLSASLVAGLAQKFFGMTVGVAAATTSIAKEISAETLSNEVVDAAKQAVKGLSTDEILQRYAVPLLRTAFAELRPAVPALLWPLVSGSIRASLANRSQTAYKSYRSFVWQIVVATAQLWTLALAVLIAVTAV